MPALRPEGLAARAVLCLTQGHAFEGRLAESTVPDMAPRDKGAWATAQKNRTSLDSRCLRPAYRSP